jgi:hypothetical protein
MVVRGIVMAASCSVSGDFQHGLEQESPEIGLRQSPRQVSSGTEGQLAHQSSVSSFRRVSASFFQPQPNTRTCSDARDQ